MGQGLKYTTIVISLFSFTVIQGCSPLSVAGMMGSTLIRTAERQSSEPKLDVDAIATANINLGIEYMRQENYEKAMEKLTVARKANPGYAPVYNAFGLLYQQMDDSSKAERNYRKAISLDRMDTGILNNFGQFLCGQNREEEAEDYFLLAATNPLNETPEIPYANAGTCANVHNETTKAVDYFERALALNPGIPTVLIQLSEIYFNAGDYPGAHDYLDRYGDLAGHTPASLWLGIRIQDRLGDKDALSSYAMLLRNNFAQSKEAALLNESGLK